MLRFEDLPEVVLGKHHRVLLLRGVERSITHVEQVVADWKVWTVFLHDAEGQQACALRARDGILEVGGGQLLPADREPSRGRRRLRPCVRREECSNSKQ